MGIDATTIEKPAFRAISFVPRLGKREPSVDRLSLERALCRAYGLADCNSRLLDSIVHNEERFLPSLALIGELTSGIPTGDGHYIRLVPSESQPIIDSRLFVSRNEPQVQERELNLLNLVSQQVKREDPGSLGEIVSSPIGGSKRVAFTPRTGR